jgi:O-antigen/teichoic acid export membrane protein
MATLNAIPRPLSGALQSQEFRQHMGRISRQSTMFFAGTIFTTAASYFFKVYLARALGAEALGIYALGITVGGVVGLFAAFGLPQAVARYVAVYNSTGRNEQLKGFLWRGALILLVSNLLVGTVMVGARRWIATRAYHAPGLAEYMFLFALVMLLGTLTTFFGQVLAGYKDITRRTVITNFIGSPLTMLLSVGFLLLGTGLSGYIVAQIISSLVVLLLLVTAAWKLMPTGARLSRGPLPPLERGAIIFSASLVSVQVLEFVFAQFDKILLGHYLNAKVVGIYAVATALTAFLPILLQSVNQIFSPTIADLHSRGEVQMLGRLYQTLTKWVLGLTLPLALVMCCFAPQLMQVFGAEFVPGWPVLVIGTFGQIINCATGSVGLLLIMSGNQNRLIRVQVRLAVVNVLANLFVIKMWGIIGAAFVAAGTNVAINLLYLHQVKNALGLSPYNWSYRRLIPPSLMALAVTLLLKTQGASLHPALLLILVTLVLSYSVFVVIALVVGLDADDRIIATAVWSRVRVAFESKRMAL